MFAVVFFHRIYESVELGNASFDHQPPSKLVAHVRNSIVRRATAYYNLDVPFVYIVRCADGTLYTGYARDPDARVKAHNSGRGARYTAGRRPVRLVYAESCESVGDALRREYALKKRSRAQKEELIGRRRPCSRRTRSKRAQGVSGSN